MRMRTLTRTERLGAGGREDGVAGGAKDEAGRTTPLHLPLLHLSVVFAVLLEEPAADKAGVVDAVGGEVVEEAAVVVWVSTYPRSQ